MKTIGGLPEATSTGSQCSANINSCSKANGLMVVPEESDKRKKLEIGSVVNVILFNDL